MAVALLATLGGFLSSSKATMTARSVAGVPVDWQVEAALGADPAVVAATVSADPHVRASEVVGFADAAGFSASTGGTTQTTGAGVVLGLPDGYRTAFPGEIRTLLGPDQGVLLTQQTAANLHVAPGDTVSISRAGLPPATVQVDGVVELPQADSLFQKVGLPPGSQPQAPPDNVIILPAADWHDAFDPVASVRPDEVRTQVHVRVDHGLPTDPSAAYTTVTGQARNLEVKLAGTGVVGDNLGAALDAARSDALYSQVLFLFLGLPGAVLAALLTATFAASGAQRRRAEQALLRTRGASVRTVTRLALVETAVIATLAGVLGIAIATLTTRLVFHSWRIGSTPVQGIAWSIGAVVAGALIAALVIAWPASRDARALTVSASRQ